MVFRVYKFNEPESTTYQPKIWEKILQKFIRVGFNSRMFLASRRMLRKIPIKYLRGSVYAAGVVIVIVYAYLIGRADSNHEALSVEIFGVRVGEFLLAFVSALLWLATNDLVRGTENTAERQLRAYISVEPRGVSEFVPNDRVLAHIGFHNTGQIFAKSVRIHWNAKLCSQEEKRPPPVDETGADDHELVIAPRATLISGITSFLKTEIAKGLSGDKSYFLYVWGIVRYHDGFKPERFTRFCHRYNFKGCELGSYTIKADDGRYHQYGNDAT